MIKLLIGLNMVKLVFLCSFGKEQESSAVSSYHKKEKKKII